MKARLMMPALLLVLGGCAATAPYNGSPQPAPADLSSADLHTNMRRLWTDHVTYTRNYIISAVDGHASAQPVLDRLLRNQEDIGNAVGHYYGAAAGQKLTALLKDHIKLAGEVVAAAKSNDTAKLTDADRRWHQNAEDLAVFLSGANPNWTKSALQDMLNKHLALTTQEATMRLHNDWPGEISTYDQVVDHAMMMADALTDGILKQFPPNT
jgi:hypothetical protein